MEQAQIWGLAINQGHLIVGSYDSGVYIFNQETGKLVQRWSNQILPRVRRVRTIQGKVYVIHGKGLSEVSHTQQTLIPKEAFPKLSIQDFPMDVFTIHGKLNVCFYFTDSVFQQNEQGKWEGRILLKIPRSTTNPKKILCGKEINGKTYLGMFINAYAVINENDRIDIYHFAPKHMKVLAPWDVDGAGDDVYFSLGNNKNLNEGYFYKHQILHGYGSVHSIPLEEIHLRKYGWSVYVDTFYKGVWFNTLTHGAIFKPHRDKWIDAPDRFQQFKFTDHFLICYSAQKLQIFHQNTKKWKQFPLKKPLVELCEYKDTLYYIDDQFLYKYHESYLQPRKILTGDYNSICVFEGRLFLFPVFGPVDYFDILKGKMHLEFDPKINRVTKYSTNDSLFIVQQEDKGFFLYRQDSFIYLKNNFKSDKTKNHFFLMGTILVRQIGNKLKFSQLDAQSFTLKSLFETDLNLYFPTSTLEWIMPFKETLYIGNSEIAFRFGLSHQELKYQGQFYIGQSPTKEGNIQITDLGFHRKIRNQITSIPLNDANLLDNQTLIEHRLMGNRLNFKTLIARSWEGQTLYLETHTPHYFYKEYGYLSLHISNEYGVLENKFIPVKKTYILDNFENGVYNLRLTHTNEVQNFLFKINKSLFFNVGFWFILIIAVLLVGFVLLQSQREKLLLSQKIVNLQLSTLKANLNPHFVFNIMNLIQALIVKSEKNKALLATSELASLNRLFLSTTQQDLITLKEELAIIKKYVNLEKMRYESDSQINFQMDISSEVILTEWEIPPLVLQPLVENAIKHGHMDTDQKLMIGLRIEISEARKLHIHISNPQNRQFKRRSNGTNLGISLVKDRLALLNEQAHLGYLASMQIYENLNSHFVVALSFEKRNALEILD